MLLGITAKAGLVLQALSVLVPGALGQQFQGDVIPNQLPGLPGSEIAFWKITDKKNRNFTLTNYFSQNGNGKRLDTTAVKRTVVIIHGLQRDPGNYMSNMLSALSQVPAGSGPDFTNTQIIAPYFPNGNDKNIGYPWDSTQPSGGYGSTSRALVWQGSGWISGENNQYPRLEIATSSFDCIDQIVTYFSNKTMYPNMNQIVVAGHSAGAQFVQRYAAVGKDLSATLGSTRLTYWVGNPNSFVWLDADRPLDTSSCPTYNDWRDGLDPYSISYNKDFVAQGAAAVEANYQSKSIAYVRGLQDKGDTSSGCEPYTTGANRDERFFNFIADFPPTCASASDISCDTIDYVDAGHDASVMFADVSGQARLFTDNFNGDLSRAPDFYCPRQVAGDSPLPDPTCDETLPAEPTGTYNGMAYQGCWTDQDPRSLSFQLDDSNDNSPASCTQRCAAKGYILAGMEYSTQCWCGNTMAAKSEKILERGCSFACPGDPSQFCGADERLSVWGTAAPVVLPEPEAPATVGDYEYAGCFYDNNPAKALTGATTAASDMTLEKCAAFCSSYTYWGVEYSQECYCGNVMSAGNVLVADSDCSMVCGGDDLEYCGNGNRLSLYSLNGAAIVYSGGATTTAATTTTGTATTKSTTTQPTTTKPVETNTSLQCPASDGMVYKAAGGQSYTVMCGVDHAAGDLSSLSTDTFAGCIDACSTTAGCLVVAYSGSACYLKSSVGDEVVDGVWGAILRTTTSSTTSSSATTSAATSSSTSTTSSTTTSVATTSSTTTISSTSTTSSTTSSVATTSSKSTTSSSVATTSTTSASTSVETSIVCPGSNSTIYTPSSGAQYLIQCGVDHAGGDMAAPNPVHAEDLRTCIDLCDARTGCKAVALSGTGCYMKSAIGAEVYDGVLGAVLTVVTPATASRTTLVTSTSRTTSSTSSSTTSSSTTSTSTSTTASTAASTTSTTSTRSTSSTTTTAPTTSTTSAKSTTSSTSTTSTTSTTSAKSTTTTTSTASVPTSTSALSSGFEALGCFIDQGTKILPTQAYSNSSNTPDFCAKTCRASHYKYSGVEYGSECWCGNTLPTTSTKASDCSSSCPGDSKQKCGAGNRINVVSDSTWKQTLFVRETYSTWSLMSCYQATIPSGAANAGQRTLPVNLIGAAGGADTMTVAKCLTTCESKGYDYCGMEYRGDCWGASSTPSSASLISGYPLNDNVGCTQPCGGNATEVCGGWAKVLVYMDTTA